ncbi:MAG: hypothetical protein ACRYGG_06090 [Janthinobacterium lividum]
MHAVLNTVTFLKGELQLRRIDIVIMILVITVVFGFQMDLGNGEGFFGPVKRAQRRTSHGRFAA